MVKTITIGNFKGGVGKSSLTEILAFLLSKQGYKVLAIDTDPQRNLTEKIQRTFDLKIEPKRKFMKGLIEFDLEESIYKVNDNLHVIGGDWKLESFDRYVITELKENASYYLLNTLLKPIREEYDFVLIDTRPSTGMLTDNAICASDYVLITTKTEEDSFTSTQKFYAHIGRIHARNEQLKFLGAVPYLVNQRGSTNKKIMIELEQLFEDDVFENYIKSSDRVVSWGKYGITTDKPYDKQAMKMYEDVKDEMLKRMELKDSE
ncbi:ParA family protein [Staphylococcus agnetis]|uniref:ParA family protein n=1 Tax=Staphylococcus agnetis TaxID=985762 RepID=UPI00208FBC53|nr:ParA family protein [Staphylococcus agnetis]MCO4353530.1 ParA family protein [Staphylococcus agnetis]